MKPLLISLFAVMIGLLGCGRNPSVHVGINPEIRGEAIVPLTAQLIETNASVIANATNAVVKLGPAVVEKIGDYTVVNFDRLASFNYDVPDEPVTNKTAQATLKKEQIPAPVKSLDRQKVALKGFMLPLKVEGGLITELLILRDQSMCCYGSVPKINEWVSVKMPTGKGVKAVLDVPITLFGTLRVGEIYENNYLVGIYEMDGDRLSGPPEL